MRSIVEGKAFRQGRALDYGAAPAVRATEPGIASIGKHTLVESFSAGDTGTEALAFFERSIGETIAQLAALSRAIAAGGPLEAITAAGLLRQSLRSARAHAANGPTVGFAERAARLADTERQAQRVLRDAREAGLVPATIAPLRAGPDARSVLDDAGRNMLAEDHPARSGLSARAIAAFGVAGAGEPVPFASELQARFGRYDLSGVRAHVGGAAGEAARSLGAQAYTLGDDIAFDGAPSLALAAHEVAHVVQQRAGVAPRAATGDAPGDAYEEHADAVADAVVRGESAEPLLDQVVGRGATAGPATPAVQRKARDAPARRPPDLYLRLHEERLWSVIGRHLHAVQLPEPNPRLLLHDEARFLRVTIGHLRSMQLLEGTAALTEVLHPARPYELIEPYLPVSRDWVPVIGQILAQRFEGAIVASLHRLGARWIELADRIGELPGLHDAPRSKIQAEALVASHPMDLAVRRGLTADLTVDLLRPVGQEVKPGAAAPALRKVRLEWQGAKDPSLWNWIRAVEPADATAEEVAASMWAPTLAGWDGPGSLYAYRLTASPPLFGVPPAMARAFAGAREHAPAPGTAAAHPQVAIASSKQAGELARAQAQAVKAPASGAPPAVSPAASPVVELLADSITLLAYLEAWLAPWQLADTIAIGLGWTTAKRAELSAATDHERAEWRSVAEQQHAHLTQIIAAVQPMARSAPAQGAGSPAASQERPRAEPPGVRKVLGLYARAAASSFLPPTCAQLLQDARAEQAGLTLGALRATANELTIAETGGARIDRGTAEAIADLQARSRAMQSRILDGQALDPEDVELTLLGTQEVTLELRIAGLGAQLAQLQAAAARLGNSWGSVFVAQLHSSFRNLDDVAHRVRNHLARVRSTWDAHVAQGRMLDGSEASSRERRRLRREALATGQWSFDQIRKDKELIDVLQNGARIIERQARLAGFVTACAHMLLMVGVSMIASPIAAGVGRLVGAGLARAGAIEGATLLARGARTIGRGGQLAGTGARLATDAAITTAAQRGIAGGASKKSGGEMFAENLLQSFGSALILSRLGKDLEIARRIEQEAAGLLRKAPGRGYLALAEGVTISSHAIINIATAYVATQIVERAGATRDPASQSKLQDWFLQGAAVGIGRHAGRRLQESKDRHARLAALKDLREAQQLARARATLEAHIAIAERAPREDTALAALAGLHAVQRHELAALQKAAGDPELRKALGMSEQELGKLVRESGKLDAELGDMRLEVLPLHMARLEELPVDSAWKGSPEAIERAIRIARDAGLPVQQARDPKAGITRLTIGARTFEIHERAAPGHGAAGPARPGPGGGEPADAATQAGRSGATATRPTAPPRSADADPIFETRAEMVPGSTFRGRGGTARGAEVLAEARDALAEVVRGARDATIAAVDSQGAHLGRDDRARAAQTFVIAVPGRNGGPPERFTIRLATGPLEGQIVARTVVNPTQQGFSPTAADRDGRPIKGRYVIQLSDELGQAHVRRAVAHEVAEILALRELAAGARYGGPDALRPGAKGTTLSPHDRGRLAEIEVLAEQLASDQIAPSARDAARTELAALVEHLGLRAGEPGAAARFALAAAHLGKRARSILGEARRAPPPGTKAHAELEAIRERAGKDLEEAARARARRGDHDMPSTLDDRGRPLRAAALQERAQRAAEARQIKSDATWGQLEGLHRAGAAKGELPLLPYELQIGGGASLAARDRAHLLIDDRGRWQADGNHEIAQTATQIRQTRDARLGDPTEIVGPNARVPRDAITYWEDHIAAQGPVVNGRASLRIGEGGELLVDILYRGKTLTFRTEKVPYVATGFVPELIPGAPRELTPTVAAAGVAEILKDAAKDPSLGGRVQAAAARAHAALARTPMVSHEDAIQFLSILGDPDLRAALKSTPEIEAAFKLGGAAKEWRDLIATDDPGRPHVFFGDQANLGREQAMRSHNWVIAGTGGTAVSAAEIILSENPKARVTMIGPNEPAGLMENDQFRMMAGKHADAGLAQQLRHPPGDGRLGIRRDYGGAPVAKDRAEWEANRPRGDRDGWIDESDIPAELRSRRVYDASDKQAHSHGTAYVAAVGRADAYPAVVASLIDQARRTGGRYRVRALFHDRQYVGYQVTILNHAGHPIGRVDVTGAASRFLPIDDAIKHAATEKDIEDLERVKAAADWDAPPESGNFAGGFAATATQAARYAAQRNTPRSGSGGGGE